MVNYEIVLKNLENSLNGSLKKESAEVFLNSVQSLKQDFNKGISTKFLKNLMIFYYGFILLLKNFLNLRSIL